MTVCTDADEDDEEDAADVVDADAVALVLDLGALLAVELPPLGLQVLQHALVQQPQDPRTYTQQLVQQPQDPRTYTQQLVQ